MVYWKLRLFLKLLNFYSNIVKMWGMEYSWKVMIRKISIFMIWVLLCVSLVVGVFKLMELFIVVILMLIIFIM